MRCALIILPLLLTGCGGGEKYDDKYYANRRQQSELANTPSGGKKYNLASLLFLIPAPTTRRKTNATR